MDGWTPDASFFPEEKEDKRPNVRTFSAHLKKKLTVFFLNYVSSSRLNGQTEMTRYSSEFYGYDSDRGGDRRSRSPPSDFGPRSDISNDSIEKNGDPAAHFERQQRRWLAELKARNAKIVQVTYPRTANNDKELTVVRGEYLEVRQERKERDRCAWLAVSSFFRLIASYFQKTLLLAGQQIKLVQQQPILIDSYVWLTRSTFGLTQA